MRDTDVLAESPSKHQLLIGDEWLQAVEGETYPVTSPATGEEIAVLASAGTRDVDLAMQAASEAFSKHRSATFYERADWCDRAAEVILSRQSDLAMSLMVEHGKPLAEAEGEVASAALGVLSGSTRGSPPQGGDDSSCGSQQACTNDPSTYRHLGGPNDLELPHQHPGGVLRSGHRHRKRRGLEAGAHHLTYRRPAGGVHLGGWRSSRSRKRADRPFSGDGRGPRHPS